MEVAASTRPAGARRPVGGRLRQHPRVARWPSPPLTTVHQPIQRDGPAARWSCWCSSCTASAGRDAHHRSTTRLVVRQSGAARPDRPGRIEPDVSAGARGRPTATRVGPERTGAIPRRRRRADACADLIDPDDARARRSPSSTASGSASTTAAAASPRTSTSSPTPPVDWDELIRDGIGQLTRPFGTAPVDPAVGARAVARSQRQIIAARPVRHSRRWCTRSA